MIIGPTPDFKFLYLSIQRCNAAYIMDLGEAKKAFADLGSVWIDRYQDNSHQAVLHKAGDRVTLTISGTRVTEGTFEDHVGDLMEDIDYTPHTVEKGVEVGSGAYDGLKEMWDWVYSHVPPTTLIDVEGHSLGGWRTQYSVLFHKNLGKMTAFEPPKAGNAGFWKKYQAIFDQKLTVVVHDKDPWFAWPWITFTFTQRPGKKILFINGDEWKWISEDEWVGGNLFHNNDHGPTSVIDNFKKLSEKVK